MKRVPHERRPQEADEFTSQGFASEIERVSKEIVRVSAYREPKQEKETLDYYLQKLKGAKNPLDEDELNRARQRGKEAASARQASCTPVDLRKSFGEVRDQDTIGWCYAYAAADLISYNAHQPMSAIDVANSYNREGAEEAIERFFGKKESELDGGRINRCPASGFEAWRLS